MDCFPILFILETGKAVLFAFNFKIPRFDINTIFKFHFLVTAITYMFHHKIRILHPNTEQWSRETKKIKREENRISLKEFN